MYYLKILVYRNIAAPPPPINKECGAEGAVFIKIYQTNITKQYIKKQNQNTQKEKNKILIITQF